MQCQNFNFLFVEAQQIRYYPLFGFRLSTLVRTLTGSQSDRHSECLNRQKHTQIEEFIGA